MSKNQVIAKLDAQVREAGSIRAWSRSATYQRWNKADEEWETAGFSASFISEVLAGNCLPSKNLLAYLGFEAVKEIRYRPIKKAA